MGNFVQTQLIKTSSVTLYSESFGNPSSPPLLLIAGSMSSCRFWTDGFCKIFANKGFFVIRYDHRDTGLSSAINFETSPYTIYDLALDALAVLDAYRIEKAHVLGGSMGGAIAQLIAIHHENRLLSLSIVASACLAKITLTEQEQKSLIQLASEMGKNKPSKDFKSSLEGFLMAWQSLHGDMPIDRDIAIEFTRDMYERTLPKHLDWLEKLAAGEDPAHNHERVMNLIPECTQELKNLRIPVTVIHGEQDRLIPIRTIQEYFCKFVPQAKMHSLKEMGHIVFSKKLFEKIAEIFLLDRMP
jgi:pimeloyl-ACP methyl ester carboxylesterase